MWAGRSAEAKGCAARGVRVAEEERQRRAIDMDLCVVVHWEEVKNKEVSVTVCKTR